jgi:hypothetical protein
MQHVFIDTNVYLTFFHFTSDELEELDKLEMVIREGHAQLHITEQVRDEFLRNREGKLAESLKELRRMKVPDRFPRLVQTYDEYDKLRAIEKEFSTQLSALIEQVEASAESKTLAADTKLAALMNQTAVKLDTGSDVIQAARLRMDLGNPPGKEGSLGDAINWEALLAGVHDGEDLAVISDDQDFQSKLDATRLSDFLIEEWKSKTGGTAALYPSISAFFRDKFPAIAVAREPAKELAIQDLIKSHSFARTHAAIARLSQEPRFTDEQIVKLVTGGLANDQVYWIGRDPDVQQFFIRIMEGKEDLFDEHTLEDFDNYFRSEPVWE